MAKGDQRMGGSSFGGRAPGMMSGAGQAMGGIGQMMGRGGQKPMMGQNMGMGPANPIPQMGQMQGPEMSGTGMTNMDMISPEIRSKIQTMFGGGGDMRNQVMPRQPGAMDQPYSGDMGNAPQMGMGGQGMFGPTMGGRNMGMGGFGRKTMGRGWGGY